MTFVRLLCWGKQALQEAGIREWNLDSWYLLEYVTGWTRNEYFLKADNEVPDSQGKRYRELIKSRSRHVPLQYLTGSQDFMGFSFFVNKHVLIPRQDTETLVETALPFLRSGMSILDLCTGTGCILLSLLKLGPKMAGAGTDLSAEALKVAERNRRSLEVQADLIESDLFSQVSGSYDRIFSNPPYIASREVDMLMEEVREYEPRMALDGGEDGLCFYKKIVKQCPAYLKPGGMLFFEIGFEQAEAVCALMEPNFTGISVVKDLSGHNRVVYGTLDK